MATKFMWKQYVLNVQQTYKEVNERYASREHLWMIDKHPGEYFKSYTFDKYTGHFKLGQPHTTSKLRLGTVVIDPHAAVVSKNESSSVIKWVVDSSDTMSSDYIMRSALDTPIYSKGAYIDFETSENRNLYPDSGKSGNYWYEYAGIYNQDPTISGSDRDLGAQFKDFGIDYLIQDPDGDDVKVEIKIDDEIKQSPTKTTLGVRRYFAIPIKDYELGRHTIEIKATDSHGASDVRIYTFNKVNSAPVISGQDTNLGSKNSSLTYTYTVTDNENDKIDVVEKINGEVIRTLNNITLGSEYKITITDEQIRKMELYQSNTIEIEATDGKATTFRRVTFIRNNVPPIIADKDKDLGEVTNGLEYSWSATDPEKDKMTAVIYLDDRILKDRFNLAEGANQTIKIDGLDMQKLSRGKHTIRIVVEDDKGFSSTRTITFTRVVPRLVMKLNGKGIETDELASRVLVSTVGVYVAKGAVVKYEVCNNSFDANPTWEDATTIVGAGKAFNFQNKTKTATKAGIDIRVTIEKGTATMQSYITAIGGSFD